jgi:hypothetical protein
MASVPGPDFARVCERACHGLLLPRPGGLMAARGHPALRRLSLGLGFLAGLRLRPGPIRFKVRSVGPPRCHKNPSPFAKFRRTMTPFLWQLRKRMQSADRGVGCSLRHFLPPSRKGATEVFVCLDPRTDSASPVESGCRLIGLALPLEIGGKRVPGSGKHQVGYRLVTLHALERV